MTDDLLAQFVRRQWRLVETESTNTLDLRWCNTPAAEELPALVLAERQTSGRGRGENRWWSGTGAILGSLIVEPRAFGIPKERWPTLSLSVGSAIAAALETLVPLGQVRLKWPNDVFADGRKAAGVLIEIPPEAPQRMVIGIGINLNNRLDDAPPDLRARAVALCELSGRAFDRETVLAGVVRQLLTDFELLGRGDPQLRDRWRRQCLLTGRSIVIADNGRTTAGTCLGIDDDGALRVQTDRAIERHFSGHVGDWSAE